jgi:hypothetical protein
MGIVARTRAITLGEVKPGHVIRIDYEGSDETLILVLDANNGGGARDPGKLHALKLQNLSESHMEELIKSINETIPRGRQNVDTDELYSKFKNSPYKSMESSSYRTYGHNKIKNLRRVQLGQPMDPSTKKIKIGRSVLYGCEHHTYVYINSNDYDTLINELDSVNYQTYFEGKSGHEETTIALLNLLVGEQKYLSKSETWDLLPDAPELELFGGDASTMWSQITLAIEERGISTDMSLIEIMERTSGNVGKYENYWSQKKVTEQYIRAAIADATRGRPDIPSLEYEYILDKNFSNISYGEFEKFKQEMEKVSFASDYKGEYGGDPYIGNQLEKRVLGANIARDKLLIKLMTENPGVYFAGHSHVDDVKKLL